MKKYLPFAMLFVCATAIEAQQPVANQPVMQDPVEDASVAPVPAEEAAVTDRTAPPVIDLKTRSATASAVEAATMRAPAPDADLMVQEINPPPNFWWLVGGIVLAGVILAILL